MSEVPIGEAVDGVRERVRTAAMRSGRRPEDVRIVAAVKGVDVELVRAAVGAGVADLGANQTQDLVRKAEVLPEGLTWHFLGSLQTNKVRYLDDVAWVHGLDRAEEAAALDALGRRLGRSWDVLVEVNVAGEPSKQGIAPDDVDALLDAISGFETVRPRGFMFMAPQVENAEDVRWVFAEGRRLGERFASFGLNELSMGMSDDFEVAVEEGSTMVRIGRAIFSPGDAAGCTQDRGRA